MKKYDPRDANGLALEICDLVRMLRVPPGLLTELLDEDVSAINWAAENQIFKVCNSAPENGDVELEFTDQHGRFHWIFVEPSCVELVSKADHEPRERV